MNWAWFQHLGLAWAVAVGAGCHPEDGAGPAGDTGSDDTHGGDTGTGGTDADGEQETRYCEESHPPGCPDGECIELCGVRLWAQQQPRLEGFTSIDAVPARSFPLSYARHGELFFRFESHMLTIRDGEHVLLGQIPISSPIIGAVDGAVLLRTLRVIDVRDPSAPEYGPAWIPEATAVVAPIGSHGDSFLFTAHEEGKPWRVSVVDVSDPFSPREVACLAEFDHLEPLYAAVAPGVLLHTGPPPGDAPVPTLYLHDLASTTPGRAKTTLDLPPRFPPFVVDGTRVGVGGGESEFAVYDIADARFDTVAATVWPHGASEVVGGFALTTTNEETWAVDLQADSGLPSYHGPTLRPDDASGLECLVTLEPDAAGESWAISPWWEPDGRFLPNDPPHPCPDHPSPRGWGSDPVRSPDGRWVALRQDVNTALFDVQQRQVTRVRSNMNVHHWIEGGVVEVETTYGEDGGSSLVVVRDPDDDFSRVGTVDGPQGEVYDSSLSGSRLWFLSIDSLDFGNREEFTVWSIDRSDPLGQPVSHADLPEESVPFSVRASTEEVYVADERGKIIVLDERGELLREVAMDVGFLPIRSVSSALGLLFRGRDGGLYWLPPGGERLLEDPRGCVNEDPLAASSSHFYLRSFVRGSANDASQLRSLVQVQPRADQAGSTFSLARTGVLPVGTVPVPGDPLVVLGGPAVVE